MSHPRIIKNKIYRYTRDNVLVLTIRPYTNQPNAWLTTRLDNNKHEIVRKFDLVNVLCPNCEPDKKGRGGCVCGGKKLKFDYSYNTDWYGNLHYWKCRCCKEKLVCQDGKELEIAAPH